MISFYCGTQTFSTLTYMFIINNLSLMCDSINTCSGHVFENRSRVYKQENRRDHVSIIYLWWITVGYSWYCSLPIYYKNWINNYTTKKTAILCHTFFKQLFEQTFKVDILKQMNDDIVLILYKKEKIFSLAFFDIMIHLTIYWPREAKLAGPI